MTKSIADAVLMYDVLGQLRGRKINTDAAATAYAWENGLSTERTAAVKAVAHGIPVRTVAKFADCPLMRLLAIITAM